MTWKTKTHVLKFPVTLGDKTYAAVTLREPDVDALEVIEELGIEEGKRPTIRQARGLIAALADVPTEALGKMHKDDLAELGEMVAPLLEGEENASPS